MNDPIGDALAIAIEAIEEHAEEARYCDPGLALFIDSTKQAMEHLQTAIDRAGSAGLRVVPRG